MTQGISSLLVFHVGYNGIAEFEDSSGALACNELSILFHESSGTGSTRQFPFETWVTGGALSFEQAQTAKNEGSGTNSSDRTAKIGVIADALTEIRTSCEIRGSRHSTRKDEQVGLEEVDVFKECIGLHADSVSSCYDAFSSDRYNLQVEACATDDVGSSKSFQLFGASGEK